MTNDQTFLGLIFSVGKVYSFSMWSEGVKMASSYTTNAYPKQGPTQTSLVYIQ